MLTIFTNTNSPETHQFQSSSLIPQGGDLIDQLIKQHTIDSVIHDSNYLLPDTRNSSSTKPQPGLQDGMTINEDQVDLNINKERNQDIL